jgi:hypothetical protein
MSYSFSLIAANKAALLELAAFKLKAVTETQPEHAHDMPAALANLNAHLALIPEPREGQQVGASMHGSVTWTRAPGEGQPIEYTGAAGGCNVYLEQVQAENAPG